MKKILLFCLLFIGIVAMCSAQQRHVRIGILTNTFDKVSVGDSLGGLAYYRIAQIGNVYDSTKNYTLFNNIINAGDSVVQNFNWTNDQPAEFCTDFVTYTKVYNAFLSRNPGFLQVIENEETNESYYDLITIVPYLDLLTIAIPIVHSHGLLVTNGGITTRTLSWALFRDLVARGKPNAANYLASIMIPDGDLHALQNPGTNPSMEIRINQLVDTLLPAYKRLPLDYVNFHWYEQAKYRNTNASDSIQNAAKFSTAWALWHIASYLRRMTGKPIISNEMGQDNNSGTLATFVLQDAADAGISLIIWNDINGVAASQAIGLNPLGENGLAFKSFIQNSK